MFEFLYMARNRRSFRFVVAGLLLAIGVLVYIVSTSRTAEPVAEREALASVTVTQVADISFANTFSVIGTVEAVSEAKLQAEAGGRITSVAAVIGQNVQAGSVLATIENRNESASLLQAQGAYEAALAGAASSNITVEQANNALRAAQNAALTAERSAYTNVSDTYYTNLIDVLDDSFFTSPSVVLIGSGVPVAKSEGKALESLLPEWQATSVALNTTSDIDEALRNAKTNTLRTIALVDTLIQIFNDTTTNQLIAGESLESQRSSMSTLRSSLNGTLSALEAAETGLKNAREVVSQAELGSTSGDVSAANAQVKIALGSLRAAQANYEKTIIRTPISGVVNALYVKAGDYVAPSQPAAIVANNNGLQITTAVSLEDSQTLAVGDSVSIDETSTGVITAIAGAIDPTTGKVAVNVSVDESSTLQNGATVTISFEESVATQDVMRDIVVPLSALKMTGSGPVVFFITPEKTLQAQSVVLGAIRGDSVVIAEGVTPLDSIVIDARGLKAGQAVTVVNK